MVGHQFSFSRTPAAVHRSGRMDHGNPRNDTVKATKTLNVYSASSIGKGMWKLWLDKAIDQFNALAKKNGIGVTLARSTTAPTISGGADVSVEAADGSISLSYGGTTWPPTKFDGSFMHGLTLQATIAGKLDKAFVFLPANPQINTPKGRRPVGENVLKLIAVHELVHACGLENKDHVLDDLFQGYPDVDYGATSSLDRIRIPGGWMPPLVLGGGTVKKIKSLWP
jgi:hypothetical protein